MMAREGHESTREPVKYGKFINQFQPDIKTNIWRFEKIETKISSQRLSVIFNQLCLNEEIWPKYTYFKYTHTHIHMY